MKKENEILTCGTTNSIFGPGWRRMQISAALLAASAFAVSVPMVAQDVAEAARQARKEKSSHAKHVYSNDDLTRHHILTPADRRQMEAKRRENAGSGQGPAMDAQSTLQELPLGDVARKYRAEKEALGEMPQSAEFHLPYNEPVLASPKPAFAFVMPRPMAVHPRMSKEPRPPTWSGGEAPKTIIVRSGDTLWKLAQKNLGDGYRWHELAAGNPKIVDPQHVMAGTQIRVVASATRVDYQSKVIVRKGDNLWRIAEAKLGFGAQWSCLAEANPSIVDANRIYVGQTLVVPTACRGRKKK